MPKIRRNKIPWPVMRHLLDRMQERGISGEQLTLLARWIEVEPEVPAGRWFKRFPSLIVCGEGELVKTFLRPGQVPEGEEVH